MKTKMREKKMNGKIFLHNDYMDTLGLKMEIDKIVIVKFAGDLMKIKVKEIKENGIMVEIVN